MLIILLSKVEKIKPLILNFFKYFKIFFEKLNLPHHQIFSSNFGALQIFLFQPSMIFYQFFLKNLDILILFYFEVFSKNYFFCIIKIFQIENQLDKLFLYFVLFSENYLYIFFDMFHR